MTKAKTTQDRFWSKVNKTGSCWLWTAHRDPNGYGRFADRAKMAQKSYPTCYAHRWAWEDQVGPIPEDMCLDHVCRNKACVNPAHLRVVTDRENILAGVGMGAQNARKVTCKKGHNNWGKNKRGRYCRTCQSTIQKALWKRQQAARMIVKGWATQLAALGKLMPLDDSYAA